MLLVVAVVGVLLAAVSSMFRFFDPMPELEASARKLAPVMDSIYLYRETHGSWPAILETALPVDVDYVAHDVLDVAEIRVYGPWHSRATYTFCKPNSLYANGWHCSIEGSQTTFDVFYDPPVPVIDLCQRVE